MIFKFYFLSPYYGLYFLYSSVKYDYSSTHNNIVDLFQKSSMISYTLRNRATTSIPSSTWNPRIRVSSCCTKCLWWIGNLFDKSGFKIGVKIRNLKMHLLLSKEFLLFASSGHFFWILIYYQLCFHLCALKYLKQKQNRKKCDYEPMKQSRRLSRI